MWLTPVGKLAGRPAIRRINTTKALTGRAYDAAMPSLIPPLPRPPLGLPDPLRRIHVPKDTGPPTAPPLSNMLTRALGVGIDKLVGLTNDPRFLTGIVPAANTVATAWELSRFFEIIRRGGGRLGPHVIDRRASSAGTCGSR